MAKIGVFKSKNLYDEYTGQLDLGELQIQVFAKKARERNRMVNACKKVIKPPTEKEFMKSFEKFLEHPYKDLYQDVMLAESMRRSAKWAFDYFTK